MATGISMSSVNKIKELAENGEYGLALDILENQDLSKSLSPQFIRVCGEVYYENHKYHEARAALVRAHSMAPAGNKIIFSLIQLYLTMGLRTLADKYYEVYKFNLEGREDAGEIRLEYLFAKADRKPVQELRAMLAAANDKEKAERWEYEHLLILAALKEQEKLKYEGEVFKATYKKSIYIDDVNELLAGLRKRPAVHVFAALLIAFGKRPLPVPPHGRCRKRDRQQHRHAYAPDRAPYSATAAAPLVHGLCRLSLLKFIGRYLFHVIHHSVRYSARPCAAPYSVQLVRASARAYAVYFFHGVHGVNIAHFLAPYLFVHMPPPYLKNEWLPITKSTGLLSIHWLVVFAGL